MAIPCSACGFSNPQDSRFCCQCGAGLAAEVTMAWHETRQVVLGRSRTPSPSNERCIDGDFDALSVSTRRASDTGLTRNSSSYALLMRLQAAGANWRQVECLSNPGSPDGSPKFMSPRGIGRKCQETKAQDSDPKDKLTATKSTPVTQRLGTEIHRFISVTELGYTPSFPRILCVARRYLRKNKYVDITGEYHLDLIQKFGGVPIIIPRTTKTIEQVAEYLPMDGLVIAEGNDLSDDILLKYGCSLPERLNEEAAKKWAGDTELDVSKDELEFALMRFALAAGVPIMTFCRGSQMLNCLRGGTLIGDIETQTDSTVAHMKECGSPEYDSHRHPITIKPGTPLAEWFADSLAGGSNELLVNSYHHQASKELGSDLVAMAHAPDGIIEGFYDPSYNPKEGNFVVGLQFHPERMLEDYPGCERCYESFLQASRAYKAVQDCASA